MTRHDIRCAAARQDGLRTSPAQPLVLCRVLAARDHATGAAKRQAAKG